MLDRVCCMRLRTAGLVVGWLGVISSIIGIIDYIVRVGEGDHPKTNAHGEMVVPAPPRIDKLITSLVNLVTACLLIYGTSKDRHRFLVPWLIATVIETVYAVGLLVFLIIFVIGYSFGYVFIVLIIFIPMLALSVYVTYGIYSLYREIESKNRPQQPMVYQPNSPDEQFIKSVP